MTVTPSPADRGSIVDGDRIRMHLQAMIPESACISSSTDRVTIIIPGAPLAVETRSVEESLTEMVEVLREYAVDWRERLHNAPNHRGNRALVELTELSTDDQLSKWLYSPDS